MTTTPETYAEFEASYMAAIMEIAGKDTAGTRISARIQAAFAYSVSSELLTRGRLIDREMVVGAGQGILAIAISTSRQLDDVERREQLLLEMLFYISNSIMGEISGDTNETTMRAMYTVTAAGSGRA